MAAFEYGETVLFEGYDGVECVRVTCWQAERGGLVVTRHSAGELSQWCFGESPHVAELRFDEAQTSALARYLNVEREEELAAALAIEFSGTDGWTRIASVMRKLLLWENYFEKIA